MSNIPERYTTDRATLADALKHLRETRFATGSAAARALGWSQPKISKIENGRVLPSVDDVEQLLDLCGASAARRAELLDLVGRLHTTLESNRTVLRHGAARKQAKIAQVEAHGHVMIASRAVMITLSGHQRDGSVAVSADHLRSRLDRMYSIKPE
jgi:transcriptional regulator with XRE-family HTH domain